MVLAANYRIFARTWPVEARSATAIRLSGVAYDEGAGFHIATRSIISHGSARGHRAAARMRALISNAAATRAPQATNDPTPSSGRHALWGCRPWRTLWGAYPP